MASAISVRALTKKFGDVLALDGAAFTSVRAEEISGRADAAVAASGSRTSWFASQVLVIASAAAAITVAAGIGSGLTAAFPLFEPALLVDGVGAALNVLPALFLMLGLGAAVYGLVPRELPLLWGYLGYVLVAALFSDVLPERFGVLSPFHHTPNLPADSFAPQFMLPVLATVLVFSGAAGFRRRDIGR
ncbi:hypothetical protein [Rhodococcus tibetensis]|uniref:ABC-2 type transport system permease protein n=1 Tax=Rhodococcus tibetensis TaxID=2965064 RepID=A0ABT1Q8T5_9NOCA|nr:hypothetical protein [Rhodococcus sp. FXJ9.536]MCQ4118668.1 hypothetical protein [Rhodococcus sp. FXJ9.536]